MIQSKLLDNFRIRNPEEGFVRFTQYIHKWQMLYLDIKDDSQIQFNIKGRQVGLSSFYKFLTMYYFMSNHKPYDITYYAPTYAMHDPKLIQMNINMLDIDVEKNKRHMLERSVGNRVFLETLSKNVPSK